MESLKAYILFPGAAKNPLYSGWLDELPIPFEIVREYDTRWAPDADAGILITHHHYRWEELSILRRLVSQSQVPVLILVDGVLEYRNSFENPELADGVMFQPLVGHKLACLGASQIRWIESWGNTGKCELVGLPRLDDLIGKTPCHIADVRTVSSVGCNRSYSVVQRNTAGIHLSRAAGFAGTTDPFGRHWGSAIGRGVADERGTAPEHASPRV